MPQPSASTSTSASAALDPKNPPQHSWGSSSQASPGSPGGSSGAHGSRTRRDPSKVVVSTDGQPGNRARAERLQSTSSPPVFVNTMPTMLPSASHITEGCELSVCLSVCLPVCLPACLSAMRAVGSRAGSVLRTVLGGGAEWRGAGARTQGTGRGGVTCPLAWPRRWIRCSYASCAPYGCVRTRTKTHRPLTKSYVLYPRTLEC
eukprot:5083716-Pyramimonas_sp.AAC.1